MSTREVDREKMFSWFRILNHEDSVAIRGYRRDVTEYELVCYINNIIGCFLSDNYKVVRIFMERARFFLENHEADERSESYFERVTAFLDDLDQYLRNKASVTKIR